MCTHRVNFYLQYTIYNLLYLISSSEEHYTFCFNNTGHRAVSQVVICEMCPSI